MRLDQFFKWTHVHRIPFTIFTILHAVLLPVYICKFSFFLALGLVLLHTFFVYAHLKQKIYLVFVSIILICEMALWQTYAIFLGRTEEFPIYFYYGKIQARSAGEVHREAELIDSYPVKLIAFDYFGSLLTLLLFIHQFYILDTQTGSVTITPATQKNESLNIVCTWSNSSSPDDDGYFENVYGMEEKNDKKMAQACTFQV